MTMNTYLIQAGLRTRTLNNAESEKKVKVLLDEIQQYYDLNYNKE